MVEKKELNSEMGFNVQVVTAIQNVGGRLSSLEMLVEKMVISIDIMDKRIEVLNEWIEFLKEKRK